MPCIGFEPVSQAEQQQSVIRLDPAHSYHLETIRSTTRVVAVVTVVHLLRLFDIRLHDRNFGQELFEAAVVTHYWIIDARDEMNWKLQMTN